MGKTILSISLVYISLYCKQLWNIWNNKDLVNIKNIIHIWFKFRFMNESWLFEEHFDSVSKLVSSNCTLHLLNYKLVKKWENN